MQDNEIASLVQKFADDLTALARRDAVAHIIAQLGGSATAPARRGPGRPRGSTNKPKRGRRSSADLAGMGDKLLAHVKANPGMRGDQIATAFGTDATSIRPAMHRLLAERKITSKGQRRGMTYHVAGSAGPKAAAKPAAKRKAKRATKKRGGRKGKTKRPTAVKVIVPKARTVAPKQAPVSLPVATPAGA